jgi:predicted PurR-regulated permease PerM
MDAEIARLRTELRRTKRAGRKRLVIGVVSVFCSLSALVGLAFAMPGIVPEFVADGTTQSGTIYGEAAIGGYALIGVAGIIVGVALTVLCTRLAAANKRK